MEDKCLVDNVLNNSHSFSHHSYITNELRFLIVIK